MRCHILSVDWFEGEPVVTASAEGGLINLSLYGEFAWTVSEARHCVGTMGHEGHVPCPQQATVTHDWQCARCAPTWAPCIFEPVDHDEPCVLCDRPHVVYLAFYGGLPKVGMTSANRVGTRLQEQGADAYLIIQRLPNRRRARETERTIAFLHGIPERRLRKEYLGQWTRPVDWALIERNADHWHKVLAERFDVEPLERLEHPLEVLASKPHVVDTVGSHEGRWLGAKGGLLCYEAQATFGKAVHAIHRGDLVGRYVDQ